MIEITSELTWSPAGHNKEWRKEVTSRSPWYSEQKEALLGTQYLKIPLVLRAESRWDWNTFLFVEPSILRAIEDSRKILELQDNWDEEGSTGYSPSTWKRAVAFLLKNAVDLWKRHRMWIAAPRILPGPYGSIDLHWQTPRRELLINVPSHDREPAAYYGDDREEGTENAIRGKKLDTSADNEWIFLWLMK